MKERFVLPSEGSPSYLTEEEANAILKQVKKWEWKVFFRLLWDTGLRVSEALAITREDIMPGKLQVRRLKRRGDVSDSIPIGSELEGYLRGIKLKRGERRLFPWTRQRASQVLHESAKAAGLSRIPHCHLFRHSLGHRVAKMDLGLSALDHLAVLAKMLGHKDFQHTVRYFQPTKEEVEEVWKKVQT